MFASSLNRTLKRGLLALVLGACTSFANAGETFEIDINTSSFASLSSGGWLDMQFNAGSGGTPVLATAVVSNLSGFDFSQVAQTSGAVTGSLASGYALKNASPDGSLTDLFQAVVFGGKVSFDVSFSGASNPSLNQIQSMFGVALYGSDQATLLGKPNGNGNLVELSWVPGQTAGQNGVVNTAVFDAATVRVSPVPEPSDWLMMGAGLALVGFVARRRAQGTARTA